MGAKELFPIFAPMNKMKRTPIILITAIYFLSICGVSGSNFYCCGKYKESYFFAHLNAGKGCMDDKNTKDCCVTKVFFVKVKDTHSPSIQIKGIIADVSTLYYPTFSELFNNSIANDAPSLALLHPPPLIRKQPVYLAYGVFLI